MTDNTRKINIIGLTNIDGELQQCDVKVSFSSNGTGESISLTVGKELDATEIIIPFGSVEKLIRETRKKDSDKFVSELLCTEVDAWLVERFLTLEQSKRSGA